jgi:hypothetical protein
MIDMAYLCGLLEIYMCLVAENLHFCSFLGMFKEVAAMDLQMLEGFSVFHYLIT